MSDIVDEGTRLWMRGHVGEDAFRFAIRCYEDEYYEGAHAIIRNVRKVWGMFKPAETQKGLYPPRIGVTLMVEVEPQFGAVPVTVADVKIPGMHDSDSVRNPLVMGG